jgi:hypothetical protein
MKEYLLKSQENFNQFEDKRLKDQVFKVNLKLAKEEDHLVDQ